MKNIYVIATIKAKEGKEDYIKFHLCKLTQPTRGEYGCIKYDFFQDKDDPTLFNSFERWKNEFALEKHLASKHVIEYLEETKEEVEEFEIKKFYRIC